MATGGAEEPVPSKQESEGKSPEVVPPVIPSSPVLPPFRPPASFTQAFGLQIQHGASADKFIEKLDSAHITDVLRHTSEESRRTFWLATQRFWGGLILGIAGVLGLCLIFLRYDKTELLEKILILFVGLIGGLLGGYGLAKKSKSD